MDLGIENKVAAVAASSSGLGLAVATALIQEGAKVAICSRNEEALEVARQKLMSVASDWGDSKDRVLAVPCDLSEASGPESFLSKVEAHWKPVDILVVNNGGPPPGSAMGVSLEDWERGVEQTFLSSVRLAKLAVPKMVEQSWGRIIFITSISVKQPIDNLAISTALRCGVVGFSKSLADEVASSGVTVNTVAPGSTDTPRLRQLIDARAERDQMDGSEVLDQMTRQVPMRRIGQPEEFASAVAFLASERASFITGVVLPVDGGQIRSIT